MNIAIGSAFRNSGGRALHYLERVAALRDECPDWNLRIIAAEGDSTDNTREALTIGARYHGLDLDLLSCNHGGPAFGSTEEPARFVALSKVCNAIFDAVRPGGVHREDDILVYIESDLIWKPGTIVALIEHAANRSGGYDVFAPLVMAGLAFYDIWGFRGLDGRRFSPHSPFYPGLFSQPAASAGCHVGLFEIGSAGSCLVMRGDVARACRVRNDYCLVGWCEDARARGYRIAVDPTLTVRQV